MPNTKQEAPKLEPCPLCACKVFKERFEKFAATTQGVLSFSYRCPKCRSQFAVCGKSEAEAMQRWNARVRADVATGEAPRSNLDPHSYQPHPHYANYCAFAVGTEDYCKREPDHSIHHVRPTVAEPTEGAEKGG